MLRSLFALALLFPATLAGCGGDAADPCETYDTCRGPALEVQLIESRTRMPANVSVLFKVDTEDGHPVARLEPAQFDIFENENHISQFESQRSILPKVGQFTYSIALQLDLSGSIVGSESLDGLKQAAQSFVDAVMFAPDDPRYGEIEMGIWWFDGSADLHALVAFTSDPAALAEGIAGITADLSSDNSTNLYGAAVEGVDLMQARMALADRQGRIAAGSVVLFTDGTDQANRISRTTAIRAVDRLPAEGSAYTIGLGGEIDEETLGALGRDGFVSAGNLGELVPRFREIANLVRDEAGSYYLLEYCSPKRDGRNDLAIRVDVGDARGLLLTDFSAENFSAGCAVAPTLRLEPDQGFAEGG